MHPVHFHTVSRCLNMFTHTYIYIHTYIYTHIFIHVYLNIYHVKCIPHDDYVFSHYIPIFCIYIYIHHGHSSPLLHMFPIKPRWWFMVRLRPRLPQVAWRKLASILNSPIPASWTKLHWVYEQPTMYIYIIFKYADFVFYTCIKTCTIP
jgi:hypothetical protein